MRVPSASALRIAVLGLPLLLLAALRALAIRATRYFDRAGMSP